MEYIKGPDILAGGKIINLKGLYDAYENGYGMIEIQTDTQTVNEDLWGDVSDFCRWYNFKLRKCFLKKAQKIFVKYEANGFIESYIHQGGKLGVMLEANGEATEDAKAAAHDVTLQIAFSKPAYLCKEEVPADVIEKEKEVLKQQAMNEGKPEAIAE